MEQKESKRSEEGRRIVTLIGNEVRTLRQHKGLTQEQTAELAGLSTAYIGQVERGERVPSFIALDQISKALGITVGVFLANLARQVSHPADEDQFMKAVLALSGRKRQFLAGIIDLINKHFAENEKQKPQ
jgi:transcriptional regulator with XRE-family HTH domain